MTEWNRFSKQEPEQDRNLWYFFDVVGVHRGQYYGDATFGGASGFLKNDVTHWQYDVGQEKPEPPEAYRINVPKDTSFLFAFSSSDIPDIHPMKTPARPTDPTAGE